MPRGVYDRSKVAKAPKKVSSKPTFESVTVQVPVTTKPKASVTSSDVQELYGHMRELTAARVALAAPGADHNPSVLKIVDSEIEATARSFGHWRESKFPTPAPEAKLTVAPLSKAVVTAPVAAAPVHASAGAVHPGPAPAVHPIGRPGGAEERPGSGLAQHLKQRRT
jgi:hypothetical protein